MSPQETMAEDIRRIFVTGIITILVMSAMLLIEKNQSLVSQFLTSNEQASDQSVSPDILPPLEEVGDQIE